MSDVIVLGSDWDVDGGLTCAMAHLTIGPHAKLALLTFSKVYSGLLVYLEIIFWRISSLGQDRTVRSVRTMTPETDAQGKTWTRMQLVKICSYIAHSGV